eukprot:m.246660 g.246660  ORF g.246660 m.246660 type:complete len:310 (+) comp15126_c0_seq1:1940-2869(+)
MAVLLREEGVVQCCQLSPFPASASLLAYSTGNLVVVAELAVDGTPTLTKKKTFQLQTEAVCLAWSPKTENNRRIVLCAAGSDHRLQILDVPFDHAHGEAGDSVVSHILQGHTNFINCCAFCHDGSLLASGGDDATVRLWSTLDGSCTKTIQLPSVCVSIAWYPAEATEDLLQFLVADAAGALRVYHRDALQPIYALQASSSPLAAADWGNEYICALSDAQLMAWEGRAPAPFARLAVEFGAGGKLKCGGRVHPNLIAIAGPTGAQLFSLQDRALVPRGLCPGHATDISWHVLRAVCVAAVGSHIFLLRV